MTTIMIRIRLVEDAVQALTELCLTGDVDEQTGFTVAPGTTGRGANAIRDLRRMAAEDLIDLDAALDESYSIIDRIDGTMDNPYAGTTGQRDTIPTRTYVMRKEDGNTQQDWQETVARLETALLKIRDVTLGVPYSAASAEDEWKNVQSIAHTALCYPASNVKPDEQASAAPSSEHTYAMDLNDRIAAAVASSDKEWVTTSEVVQALRKMPGFSMPLEIDPGASEEVLRAILQERAAERWITTPMRATLPSDPEFTEGAPRKALNPKDDAE